MVIAVEIPLLLGLLLILIPVLRLNDRFYLVLCRWSSRPRPLYYARIAFILTAMLSVLSPLIVLWLRLLEVSVLFSVIVSFDSSAILLQIATFLLHLELVISLITVSLPSSINGSFICPFTGSFSASFCTSVVLHSIVVVVWCILLVVIVVTKILLLLILLLVVIAPLRLLVVITMEITLSLQVVIEVFLLLLHEVPLIHVSLATPLLS